MSHYDIYRKGFLGIKSEKISMSVTDNGIDYYGSLGSLGMIFWNDIEKIRFEDNKIIILLKDFSKIEGKLSKLNKKVSQLYHQNYNGHIVIFPQHVNTPLVQLYNLLLRFHEKA